MTLTEAKHATRTRLERTLRELAARYPDVLARVGVSEWKIDDPFLNAAVDAVAANLGEVEYRGERLAPRVFERLRECVRGGPELPLVPATVLEFRLRDGHKSQWLAAGTAVRPDSTALNASEGCAFRTTTPIAVRPWRVGNVEYGTRSLPGLPFDKSRRSGLRIALHATHKAVRKSPQRVRVYIAADDAAALQLLQAAFAQSCGAFASHDGKQWRPVQVQPVGFSPAHRLFPGGGLHSAALVREVLAFPRKHYFIDLIGIDLPPGRDITIALTFNTTVPALGTLRADDLRLNCVPAVNLFPVTPDGIRIEAGRTEYPVTLGRLAEAAELYSVDGVVEVGRDERRNEVIRRPCPKQYSAGCGGSELPGSHAWHLTRLAAGDGPMLSVVRTRHSPDGVISRLELAAMGTDGARATRMAPGTPMAVDGGAETCSAVLLHRPTSLVRPKSSNDPADELFDDVGPPRWSLLGTDAVEVLRNRLRPHLLPACAADAELALRGLMGFTARGSGEYRLAFDASCYPGQAPWLFAAVVREFLQRGSGIGSVPRVEIDLNASRGERP